MRDLLKNMDIKKVTLEDFKGVVAHQEDDPLLAGAAIDLLDFQKADYARGAVSDIHKQNLLEYVVWDFLHALIANDKAVLQQLIVEDGGIPCKTAMFLTLK